MRIDAWLCDLKDFAIKDGLHVYGRAAPGDDAGARGLRRGGAGGAARGARRAARARRGRRARRRAGGPTCCRPGATSTPPIRGRCRRRPPSRSARRRRTRCCGGTCRSTATGRGRWSSTSGAARSLRTGGEAIAQGLALMGCRPVWDDGDGAGDRGRGAAAGGGRAAAGRRDLADLGAVPRHVRDADRADRRRGRGGGGARGERGGEPAGRGAGRGRGGSSARRPGPTARGRRSGWRAATGTTRAELGRAYLDGGRLRLRRGRRRGRARRTAPSPSGWRRRSCWCIPRTIPARDILEGSADVAFVGGFAAAVAALGGKADLVVLDTTDPARPRARSLARGGDAGGAGAGGEPAVHRRADAARAARARRSSPRRSTG